VRQIVFHEPNSHALVPPLAPGARLVQHRVHHAPAIHPWLRAMGPTHPKHRLEQLPLLVGQIRRIRHASFIGLRHHQLEEQLSTGPYGRFVHGTPPSL
jgi:hypothetical protein